mgnify:CR=1 FL=1
MVDRSKIQIHRDAFCLVFCEGRDEEYFFRVFQEWCKKEKPWVEGIQFVDCGGGDEIRKCMWALISTDGFEHIRGVGIIRDAEKNVDAATASVKGILNDFFEKVPNESFCIQETYMQDRSVSNASLKVGFVVLPGCRGENGDYPNGALENLCCRIFCKDNTTGQHILNQVEARRGEPFRRKHKNLLHIQFSLTDDFVGMKIGEAARAGAFNFQHDIMCRFGEFFSDLAKNGH